jgi:regulator of protease activity HflC (stomatin/prohibitin superfamily)
MADENMSRLLEQTTPDDEGGPLSLLCLALVFLLFLALLVFLGLPVLPPPFDLVAGWIVAFLVGVPLAGFVLLVLTALGLKSRWAWRIAGALLILGWFAWAFAVPKPDSVDPLATGAVFVALAVAAVVMYAVGLYWVSGYLLPILEKGGRRREVFKLLQDYLAGVNYPCYVITGERREEDRIVQRIKGNPFEQLNVGPGIIISDCDTAVAVSDGIKFKGVQGPGTVFTTFGDQPIRTLHLRPQLRTETPHGLTQDGIEVEVLFFAPFQIDRGGREPQLGKPFPYRKAAAFRAVHGQKMEHPTGGTEDTKQRSWDELPQIVGARVMQDILSGYRFDELYGPYDIEGEPPRAPIARDFLDRLGRELQMLGIQLVGGGISNLMPADPAVLEQRVRSWQAEWTRQVMVKQARSQAERLQRIEQARADAQADLILALGERLVELDRPGVGVKPEEILLQFLGMLEEMAMRPALRRLIPGDMVRDVRRMREPLEE